jgi:hypothetical protein
VTLEEIEALEIEAVEERNRAYLHHYIETEELHKMKYHNLTKDEVIKLLMLHGFKNPTRIKWPKNYRSLVSKQPRGQKLIATVMRTSRNSDLYSLRIVEL